MLRRPSILFFCFASLSFAQQIGSVGDWPDWRGPDRDGVSREKGLPEKWSLAGQNLAWKAPYGGRSAPIVLGDHLYLENTSGKGETEQERLMCFHADTGKLLWEYKFNLYQSDVPAHRVGMGVARGGPGDGQRLFVRGQQSVDRAHQGRQETLGALHYRRVLAVHHPRRTHRFADRRRQSCHRQHAHLDLGNPGQSRAAVHRARISAPAKSYGSAHRAAVPMTPATLP